MSKYCIVYMYTILISVLGTITYYYTCLQLSLIQWWISNILNQAQTKANYILITNQKSFMQKLFQSSPKDKCKQYQF